MASQQQLSEEELRQYVAQLREAPVADLLTQAYTMLGAWAEAKLGRSDARTLIDGLSGLVQGATNGLPADLAKQMRDGIAQLQYLQVQAEQQLASQQQPTTSEPTTSEGKKQPADASSTRTEGPKAGRAQPTQSERPMTDRLWIPGRDPRPR